jgi:hypothetical protein
MSKIYKSLQYYKLYLVTTDRFIKYVYNDEISLIIDVSDIESSFFNKNVSGFELDFIDLNINTELIRNKYKTTITASIKNDPYFFEYLNNNYDDEKTYTLIAQTKSNEYQVYDYITFDPVSEITTEGSLKYTLNLYSYDERYPYLKLKTFDDIKSTISLKCEQYENVKTFKIFYFGLFDEAKYLKFMKEATLSSEDEFRYDYKDIKKINYAGFVNNDAPPAYDELADLSCFNLDLKYNLTKLGLYRYKHTLSFSSDVKFNDLIKLKKYIPNTNTNEPSEETNYILIIRRNDNLFLMMSDLEINYTISNNIYNYTITSKTNKDFDYIYNLDYNDFLK